MRPTRLAVTNAVLVLVLVSVNVSCATYTMSYLRETEAARRRAEARIEDAKYFDPTIRTARSLARVVHQLSQNRSKQEIVAIVTEIIGESSHSRADGAVDAGRLVLHFGEDERLSRVDTVFGDLWVGQDAP